MSDDLLLAIDVGNSRIKAALLEAAAAPGTLPVVVDALAIPTNANSATLPLANWLGAKDASPKAVILGGVVPAVIDAIREGWRDAWGPLTVLDRPSTRRLLNRADQPDRVGSDRLFDAVAANQLRPAGAAAIVIDSGTATTVDLVSRDGAFLGGSIIAGFELVASALHERTALLPKISPADLSPPPAALGSNTSSAIRSGLYWGLVGGVKELIAQLAATSGAGSDSPPLVLLTGGAAPLLAENLPAARHEPHLTLQGMVLAAEWDVPTERRG